MKWLVLVSMFCVVPLISCKSIGGRETDTCIADYLKNKGLIGSEYGSDKAMSQICNVIVEVTKNSIFTSVSQEIMSDRTLRAEGNCIINLIGNSDFGDNLLLMYVYETEEGGDALDRAKKMQLLEAKINKATYSMFLSCQAEKKFGEMFDWLLTDETSEEEETDPKEDYCIRKHIIDNELIDLHTLKLQVNPKNLDTSEIDCNVLYQKALKEAEDDLVKALMEEDSSEETSKLEPTTVTCLMNTIRDGDFINKMLKFDYVKEFKLTKMLKTQLREEFIGVMTALAESASKCFF